MKTNVSKCITDYIHRGNPCPCHPLESAFILEAIDVMMRQLAEKCLKELAREIIDDELILSEEIIA